MLGVVFQRSCAVMLLLCINMSSSPVAAYAVVLNVTIGSKFTLLGLESKYESNFGRGFTSCVCDSEEYSCDTKVVKLTKYNGPLKQALTAEEADYYSRDDFFQCSYSVQKMYCSRITESMCPSVDCTINILIKCPYSRNTVLTWESTQYHNVLDFSDVPVIDCCQSSTTTTEVTTMATTPFTTFTSTNATTEPTITTFVEDSSDTTVGFIDSTSPTPNDITSNSPYWRTSSEVMEKTATPTASSNQQNGTYDASSQFSGQHIGIIVGVAVAAIIVTLAITYILWVLKTRRKKSRRKKETERAQSVSGNVAETPVANLGNPTQNRGKQVSKTIGLISPLVQSAERESHFTQTAGDYTYIDVRSTASSKSNNASAFPSPSADGNHYISRTVEVVTEIQDGEYSHLRTNKLKQENPYNWLDYQNRSVAIQPALLLDHQQPNQYLQTSNSDPRLTDPHISGITQVHAAGKDNGLFSKLGESTVQYENTSGSNNESDKVPAITMHNNTTKPNSHTMSETILSQNKNLQLFNNPSEYKIMDVLKPVPYTYTEVVPKTTREKSDDSNQLNESNNQPVLTTSPADHLLPRATESCEPGTEISMTQEIVTDHRENNEHSAERRAFFNAAYSLHDLPDQGNVSFSVDDATYANVV